MKKKDSIIVDEAVSEETARRFQSFLRKKGYGDLKVLFIAKKHPGMPDNLIIHHFLKDHSIFLTTDRPLHNTVLSRGLTSYYVKKGHFTGKKLKGIQAQDPTPLHKNDLTIKDSYRLSEPEIRSYLLPGSEKRLKKLRTKRRRIRNHFGGFDRLDLNAITVSWRPWASSTLIGVKFRISSNIGIKAFDAGESYIREQVSPERRDIVAVNHALILSIQLVLHRVKTCVYYDSPGIDPTAWLCRPDQDNPHVTLFAKLSKHFPHIEYAPSTKGRFIERLRAKLEQLSKGDSNEVIVGNMSDILRKL
ncbi:MAG: hypothetical protein GY801_45280 [bacterium]|nr:hypothetical protein [bacterium]